MMPELRVYQKEIADKYAARDYAPLFLQMGAGKTATALEIVRRWFRQGDVDSMLVIAPNGVHLQWLEEMDTWWGGKLDYCAQLVDGKHSRLEPFYTAPGTLNVVAVNVDTFSTPHKWEQVVEWAGPGTAIVLDEATAVKNIKAKRSQRIVYKFNDTVKRGNTILSSTKVSKKRIALTGTPIANGPENLWAIMEFLQPNYFSMNLYQFTNRYCMTFLMSTYAKTFQAQLNRQTWQQIKRMYFEDAVRKFGVTADTYNEIQKQTEFTGAHKHMDELKLRLKNDAVFMTIDECVDLPDKNYIVRRVPMSKAQEAAYQEMKCDLCAACGSVEAAVQTKVAAVIKMQQIASGFLLGRNTDVLESGEDFDIEELPATAWLDDINPRMQRLLSDVDEARKPVIVMTHFTAEAARIEELLEGRGYRVMMYTGWRKTGDIADFRQGLYDVLVANIAAVARGFNLQNCDTILFYSNTYSLEYRLQAEGRIYRMGQERKCTFIDYRNSPVDDVVAQALSNKCGMLDYIMDKNLEELI